MFNNKCTLCSFIVVGKYCGIKRAGVTLTTSVEKGSGIHACIEGYEASQAAGRRCAGLVSFCFP